MKNIYLVSIFLAATVTYSGKTVASEANDLQFFGNCWDKIGQLERLIPLGQMGSAQIQIRRKIDGLLHSCGEREKVFMKQYGYQPSCKTNENYATICRKPSPEEIAKKQADENARKVSAEARHKREIAESKEAQRREALRLQAEADKRKKAEALWE